jgi:hypothetical protein
MTYNSMVVRYKPVELEDGGFRVLAAAFDAQIKTFGIGPNKEKAIDDAAQGIRDCFVKGTEPKLEFQEVKSLEDVDC